MSHSSPAPSSSPSSSSRFVPGLQFRPRLLDVLHGYSRQRLVGDLGAGATVGVVALPLAMAFAIASGLPPQSGLWTAIIGGLLVALLGGSSVQIAGPAGAFIVIVYGIVQQHGVGGLLVATTCAGVLLMLLGALRLGNVVRFVPVTIVIGFTNGIAVLIALSQLKDALGLQRLVVARDAGQALYQFFDKKYRAIDRARAGAAPAGRLGVYGGLRIFADEAALVATVDGHGWRPLCFCCCIKKIAARADGIRVSGLNDPEILI